MVYQFSSISLSTSDNSFDATLPVLSDSMSAIHDFSNSNDVRKPTMNSASTLIFNNFSSMRQEFVPPRYQ
jgi:hypothetical protein